MVAPTVSDAFDSLLSRFLLNLPEEEFQTFERVFYQLQQAHWFYSDYYSDKYAHLPKFNLYNFCLTFFRHSTLLQPHLDEFETLWNQFRLYLGTIPVCGCIVLSPKMDKCLVVRSWYGKSWGFPRGKINCNESPQECAAREVKEEVGYNVEGRLQEDVFIDGIICGKEIRFYIITGVPLNTRFVTETQKEIREIKWIPIKELSDNSQNKRYWNIRPFIKPLERWIANGHSRNRSRSTPMSRTPQNKKTSQPRQQPMSVPNLRRSRSASNRTVSQFVTPQCSRKLLNSINFNESPSVQKSSKKGKPTPPTHNKQHSRKQRQQQRQRTSKARPDAQDSLTFGSQDHGWDPEEMFRTNEKLFNVKSTVPDAGIVYGPNTEVEILRFLETRKCKVDPTKLVRHAQEKYGQPSSAKKENKPKVANVKKSPPKPKSKRVAQVKVQEEAYSKQMDLLSFRFDTNTIMQQLVAT